MRRKGMQRRVHYGEKGSKMETLIKTVKKKMTRARRKAAKKYQLDFNRQLREGTIKRFRNDATIGIARGLDAINLNPKNPEHRMLRAKMQMLGQKMSDLSYETAYDSDARRDPEKHHELRQTLAEMGNAIGEFGGDEALEAYNKAYANTMKSLQIAHEEAARKHKMDR